MRKYLGVVAAFIGLGACAASYAPVTVGSNQFAALELCPADGRLVSPLASYTVIECGYKPDEYAIARNGEVLEVIGPEAYVNRIVQLICPEADLSPVECQEQARRFVSERQAIKTNFADQRERQRAQEFSARLSAAGAALQAMDPVITPPPPNSRLGPSPSMMTGFLTSQYTQGTMRTCVYNVGGEIARRTIPMVEMCPLSW